MVKENQIEENINAHLEAHQPLPQVGLQAKMYSS
jgi:hypothetical protein